MKPKFKEIAEQGKTLMLKVAIFLIGFTVVGLCAFWLPWIGNVLHEMYPEFGYVKYPLLIGIYITTIPFFVALYSGLKLLSNIDRNEAFSESSVESLKYITICASTITLLYVFGIIILITVNAGNPGILLLGAVITFASIVIAVFAAVLQRLFKSAMALKTENDLTV
ncbi:putative membrane protein [Halalkalibacter wakoensis JCM 9140]|uniref:Putative membrane protein n=1 Tax=Halalkalibacter wakoensis JCM 9140 TaxID=1236970 RepID=W4Q1G3_9BACI|nr:DUF2975 domain-containing protein [Halalkalibacter wakoensis]GAE25553.1 putative membrane protein [Halalkalibacter wakoensis JCM 9140]